MTVPSASPPAPARRRSLLTRVLLGAAVILCAAWVVHFAHHKWVYEETDDAFLQGHMHLVSSRVAGTVREVLVREYEAVQPGQVLARLESDQAQLLVQKAKAALAQTQAQTRQAQAAVEQAKAEATQAEAEVARAEATVTEMAAQLEVANVNFGRNQRLFQGDVRAVSKSEVDTTRSTADAGRASLSAAQASLRSARARSEADAAAVDAAVATAAAMQAGEQSQAAAVRDAELELSYRDLIAPVGGRLGNKNIEVGNRVQSGQSVFALVAPEVWVQANFKETQLRHMHPGQAVDISVDAVGGRTFRGHIESFSPATGAQFAMLPADNATGNFTKVVQRLPVKIVLDPESVRGVEDRLQPGLSTVVSVRVK